MKNEKRNACGKKTFDVQVLLSPGDHIVNKFKFILVGKKFLDICQLEIRKKFGEILRRLNRHRFVHHQCQK